MCFVCRGHWTGRIETACLDALSVGVIGQVG